MRPRGAAVAAKESNQGAKGKAGDAPGGRAAVSSGGEDCGDAADRPCERVFQRVQNKRGGVPAPAVGGRVPQSDGEAEQGKRPGAYVDTGASKADERIDMAKRRLAARAVFGAAFGGQGGREENVTSGRSTDKEPSLKVSSSMTLACTRIQYSSRPKVTPRHAGFGGMGDVRRS